MKKILLITILLIFVYSPAFGATYNWYFSDDVTGNAAGNDTTGDGSIGTPWKTLSKAQTEINGANSDDIVNLFFDRTDTWSMNTAAVATTHTYGITVDSSDPTVHIDWYGAGAKPIFDGLVTDFSSVPDHNTSTGPRRWNRIFEFQKTNCSISNVEIKRCYAHGIFLVGGDGFTLSDCDINDFGSSSIAVNHTYGIEGVTIENNDIHLGQQLFQYGKRAAWGNGIALQAMGSGSDSMCRDNIVRYNLVYDIYGEGISAPNSLIEYNVIGDTMSIGINIAQQDYDCLTATVRDNYLISSAGGGVYGITTGIRLSDEMTGGTNSAADINIYGNIMINRSYGIRFYCSDVYDGECNNPYGSVKIYNNTAIDCKEINYYLRNPEEALAGYVYNNASIFYERTGPVDGVPHSSDMAHANWTFSHNAFYPVDAYSTIGTGWDTANKVTGDPLLPGEAVHNIDWNGQTGATYFSDIEFDKHLYPPSNSALVNAGVTLSAAFNAEFLTEGTDFAVLPGTVTKETVLQGDHGNWDIGAIIYRDPSDAPPNMTLMCKFDTGVNWLRDEISDNDTYWTNNNATTSTTRQQGSHSGAFENTAPGDWLSRAGTVNDFGMATNGAFTLCGWVRATDLTDDFRIFAKGRSVDSEAGYILKVKADNSISGYYGWNDGGTANNWEEVPHGTPITVNQWYWVCWAHTVSTRANLLRIWSDTGDVLLGSDYTTAGTETMTGHIIAGDLGVGADPLGGDAGDLLVDNLVFYDRALTADEIDQARTENWDSATLTNSTAPAVTYDTVGDTVTVTITTSVEAWVENGIPYATLETGYEDARAYYIGKTSTTISLRATLTVGMRSTDLVWKDVNITLPSGCTMQNAVGDDFTLTIPDSGAITNTTVIAVPSSETSPITVGSGADIAKISDMSHQLNTDVYQYLEPVTDNVTITADSVLITGIGRTQVNTGTVPFTGDNNHVRCVRFNSGDLNMGLDPDSTWPDGVETLNQNEYGSGWEIGAYVYG